MLLMLACVIIAVSAIGYKKYLLIQAGIAMGKSFAPPPSAVTTLKIQKQAWSPALTTIGSIRAVQAVTITTDLAGIVSAIHFESGQPVRKGDPLLQLQDDQEQAQLHSAQARRDLAKLELARKQSLQAKNTLASSEVDSQESELRQANAAVEQAQALSLIHI
jgi:membrane fusion protein (multidrug efflux system)